MSSTRTQAERLRALMVLRDVRREARADERAVRSVRSDINVTPLVDVVLVLLIIFMVVTPLIASGVAVDLPRTAHHARKPDDGKDIIVSITQDERLYVGTKSVTRAEDIGLAVSRERQKFPDKSVFVKGDTRASFGLVRQVMDALYQQHITDVTLGTEELAAPPPGRP